MGQATSEQTEAEIVLAADQQVALAIGAQAAGEAAIALETEVCRQAPVVEALLAVLRTAAVAHARAVREVRPVWEARVAAVPAAAVGGGNQ